MEAKQIPLIELLERVPQDARVLVKHDQFSSSSHPVGRLCHEAAAALRTALKQPERKPLSDEEIWKIYGLTGLGNGMAARFARAIEAAHGIKEKE